MSSHKRMDMMKDIQENILNFLEEESESEEKFQTLTKKFNNTKIRDNMYDLLLLLHLISKIENNHHRTPYFFSKIERILNFFKDDIKKYFPNNELFHIFRSNKRILLYLIDQQLIIFNESIVTKITKKYKFIYAQYPQYFQPEIQPFINEKWFPKKYSNRNELVEELKKELPQNFYEKRKEGENDNKICELIRKDMINEFIQYAAQNCISFDSKIPSSIYETNSFFLKMPKNSNKNNRYMYYDDDYEMYDDDNNRITLIEYAAFFGSIQIFKYLHLNGVELTKSLWILAIHSQNPEIISFLKDNNVELMDGSYSQVFNESIKCHHNDFANYFIDNFLPKNIVNSQDTINQNLKYYNFAFLENQSIGNSSFFKLCKYDYCAFVDDLLKSKAVDINQIKISNFNYLIFKFILFNEIYNHTIK